MSIKKYSGFTIVELLIVIVVIAILATISVVAYNGITRRAAESTLKQDIASANRQIGVYQAENDSLPLANNCPSPAATEICLKGSKGTTFTYAPNSPTAPTSYQLLATNGTVSFKSSDGSPPESSYGGQFITLTNMAQNGDFSSGQTGWLNYCQNGSQCVFGGGVLTITANPAGRAQAWQNVPGTYTDGDKIFYSARVRKDSGSGLQLNAYRNGGGFLTVIMTPGQFDGASAGQFARYSGLRTFVASQGDRTDFAIGDSAAGKTFQATIDDVVIINLTATFGAGHEPSASAMEGILSQFENGWFSGTVTATY